VKFLSHEDTDPPQAIKVYKVIPFQLIKLYSKLENNFKVVAKNLTLNGGCCAVGPSYH
jgi:hypothetical protein